MWPVLVHVLKFAFQVALILVSNYIIIVGLRDIVIFVFSRVWGRPGGPGPL